MSELSRLDVDTVVIGGGAMGSATARALALKGVDVLLLERFEPGHKNGASHGASRNFNVSYADPTYVAMLREALPLWRGLEGETGLPVLELTGIANHGNNPDFPLIHEALSAAGIPSEALSVAEAERRWPGIRFDTTVLYTPEAGRLNADAAVAALQASAVTHGAQVRHGARVLSVRVLGDDRVSVLIETPTGEETIVARRAVVTVGAWTQKLLGDVLELPSLVVTQEQPAHFAVRDPDIVWPGFNHAPDPTSADYDWWYTGIYGMFTPGEGVKAGWHGSGPLTDPDARTWLPEPAQLAALQRYAREWLPGTDPDDFVPISCTYTTTADSNFVLDRVGPVVVGAGFSGHGFKFTPTVGRILADLVDDSAPAPALFGLRSRR
ncbi:FAD-dependent oxidoreductase [Glaciihabitans sp. dw_435]|uniref:FAD-dependent oxidoreductase n=1 Tax=Glaciihabitans sp. dw_435 TaxID=2720081 RepID=UPI0027DE806F|nr:FAD-dependent oxidoreductase [Glaciihabitans sp. dw_435]